MAVNLNYDLSNGVVMTNVPLLCLPLSFQCALDTPSHVEWGENIERLPRCVRKMYTGPLDARMCPHVPVLSRNETRVQLGFIAKPNGTHLSSIRNTGVLTDTYKGPEGGLASNHHGGCTTVDEYTYISGDKLQHPGSYTAYSFGVVSCSETLTTLVKRSEGLGQQVRKARRTIYRYSRHYTTTEERTGHRQVH